MNVDKMLDEISSKQLTEWMAYDSVEPFGEWRQDLRFAQLMTIYANSHRDTKNKSSPYKTEEFMPKFRKPQSKRQTPQQMLMIMKMLAKK